jgi:hypothetical protein
MSTKLYPLPTCSSFPNARYLVPIEGIVECTDLSDPANARYLVPLDDPKQEDDAYGIALMIYDARCRDFPDDLTGEEADLVFEQCLIDSRHMDCDEDYSDMCCESPDVHTPYERAVLEQKYAKARRLAKQEVQRIMARVRGLRTVKAAYAAGISLDSIPPLDKSTLSPADQESLEFLRKMHAELEQRPIVNKESYLDFLERWLNKVDTFNEYHAIHDFMKLTSFGEQWGVQPEETQLVFDRVNEKREARGKTSGAKAKQEIPPQRMTALRESFEFFKQISADLQARPIASKQEYLDFLEKWLERASNNGNHYQAVRDFAAVTSNGRQWGVDPLEIKAVAERVKARRDSGPKATA